MDLLSLISLLISITENIEADLTIFIFLSLYKKMSAFFLTIEAEKETPTVNNSIIKTYFDRPIELDYKKKK